MTEPVRHAWWKGTAFDPDLQRPAPEPEVSTEAVHTWGQERSVVRIMAATKLLSEHAAGDAPTVAMVKREQTARLLAAIAAEGLRPLGEVRHQLVPPWPFSMLGPLPRLSWRLRVWAWLTRTHVEKLEPLPLWCLWSEVPVA